MRNLGQFPSADELSMMLKEIDIDGKFSALIAFFAEKHDNCDQIKMEESQQSIY